VFARIVSKIPNDRLESLVIRDLHLVRAAPYVSMPSWWFTHKGKNCIA